MNNDAQETKRFDLVLLVYRICEIIGVSCLLGKSFGYPYFDSVSWLAAWVLTLFPLVVLTVAIVIYVILMTILILSYVMLNKTTRKWP